MSPDDGDLAVPKSHRGQVVRSHIMTARALRMSGDLEGAIHSYSLALRLQPNHREALAERNASAKEIFTRESGKPDGGKGWKKRISGFFKNE